MKGEVLGLRSGAYRGSTSGVRLVSGMIITCLFFSSPLNAIPLVFQMCQSSKRYSAIQQTKFSVYYICPLFFFLVQHSLLRYQPACGSNR